MGWMQKTVRPYVVFTDGSCLLNPGGAGGWAAVISKEDMCWELTGGQLKTTSNRMELTAAIEALKSLPTGSNVFLFTDSQYVRNGIVSWMAGWKAREWKYVSGDPIANPDLWKLLDEQNSRHIVSWHWVKGHAKDEKNERCDELAYAAAKKAVEDAGCEVDPPDVYDWLVQEG